MFQGDEILAALLAAEAPREVRFDNGEVTMLLPVRFVPPLDNPGRRRSLAGDWRVARWPFPGGVEEAALAAPAVDDSGWEQLQQPGRVFYQDPETCPGDVPNWNRIRLDHIDELDGAVLRRRVTIPADWAGRRVLLRFGAIYPAGRVYLNGELLGEHLSGLTPAEWDVSGRVRPGERAVVAVRLLRKHPYVDLDMPRHGMEFAGLAQDACFHCVEPCHVAGYHLLTEPDREFRGGSVAGRMQVVNRSEVLRPCTVSLTLVDPAGAVVGRAAESLDVPAGGAAEVFVPLWNAESRKALEAGRPILCRCIVLDPTGYRPITHDILVVPEAAVP